LESRLDLLQPSKAREQQPDGDQQHERERDFGDEQGGSQTSAGSDRSTSRFLQRFLHVQTCRLPRGQQADRHAGDERHGHREAKRQRIDPDFDRARNEIGSKGDERGQRPLRQQQARRATKAREQHAFGDELADHVESRRAECEARRDLPSPAGEAREHEIGDVRARNQEHTSHGAEEQQITLSLLPDRIVQKRHHLDLRRRVDVGGIGGAVIGGHDVHRFARLRQRHPRSQSRDRLKKEAAAIQLRCNEERHFGRAGHPELKLIQWECGCRFGQNADDDVRGTIERQGLTQHRRIAIESLLPHRVADQDDVLAAA